VFGPFQLWTTWGTCSAYVDLQTGFKGDRKRSGEGNGYKWDGAIPGDGEWRTKRNRVGIHPT